MSDLTRLDTRLGEFGIDFEIGVKKEIAQHSNAELSKASEDFFETLGSHADHRFMIA